MDSRIIYDMEVYKSLMDIGHCVYFKVSKDFFCICSNLTFLGD